ncbi:MAG: PD-(D/E)XK nuclease family protein, partial [Gammaproteobacteria bacterium]|nr:PD-(D/E)XK nuclease family protein [Gammaproteobacteria bacterium]
MTLTAIGRLMTARKKGPIPPDYHVSVSQFKLFYACPRKYWYKYPMGIPTPTTSSLALGTATHSVLERYLTMPDWQFDWEEDKAHKTAAPGIQFLPAPGTVNVETKISVPIAGLELVGAVDWYSWNMYPEERRTLDIGDHKTSKDPGKWAKTEQQLKTDLQMNVYAAALQRQLDIKADKLVLRHVTYRTVGVPYALPTTVVGDLKYAEMTWNKLEKTVPRIIALRKETNSNNVPTVQGTCGAY